MGREGQGPESDCTAPAYSQCAAKSRAGSVRRQGMSGLGPDRPDSDFTIPPRPPTAAQKSGFRPYLVPVALGLIFSHSSSNFTISSHTHSVALRE